MMVIFAKLTVTLIPHDSLHFDYLGIVEIFFLQRCVLCVLGWHFWHLVFQICNTLQNI